LAKYFAKYKINQNTSKIIS